MLRGRGRVADASSAQKSEDLEEGGIMRGRNNQIRAGPEVEGAIIG